MQKNFDDSVIFNQQKQIYIIPDENWVNGSEKYKIGILGGGVSGISAAYYARKMFPYAQIIIFEREKELGGWMKTVITEKFVHELGPRSIRHATSKMTTDLLNMFDELHLLNRIIKDQPRKMKIHLIQDENLKTTTLQKWKLILKFIWFKIRYKIDKRVQKKVFENDLTVEQFFEIYMRKEHNFITKIIDPFLSGIWAGKISELSAKSTLHGMLTFLRDKRISSFTSLKPRSKRVKRYLRYLKGCNAYVFKSGFQELTSKFTSVFENNKIDAKYESSITKITETNNQFEITYSTIQNQNKVEIKEKGFDFIISALPAFTLNEIF